MRRRSRLIALLRRLKAKRKANEITAREYAERRQRLVMCRIVFLETKGNAR